MMPKMPLRRGSALLIVLGMMSFMLFSGIAFAVYMRSARLPTSFLRRTTTSRQLVKAALAEAIEQIDSAIGNDPHPGVCSEATYSTGALPNTWRHRVFFGSDLRGTASSALAVNTKAPSVLTLEGLAYLPPNLINDVRFFSRCTPTAQWKPFWFDSGRYAYVAVDVSDYFDINRLKANVPRAASPDRRISLAHLFETINASGTEVEHTGVGNGASTWDEFVKDSCGTEEPFVSLADFNIAWGEGTKNIGTAIKNPFRLFVETGSAYGGITSADPMAEYYKQLTFVTDSWSPTPTPTNGIEVADILADDKWQPFDPKNLKTTAQGTLDEIAAESNWKELIKTGGNYLGKLNGGNGLSEETAVALWDYLDDNVQPLTLALPTCERVPMVCAIQPQIGGSIKVTKTESAVRVTGSSGSSETAEQDVTFSIDFSDVGSGLDGFVGLTYPFLLKGRTPKESFDADGRVALFLTEESTDVRARRTGGRQVKGLYLESDGDVQQGGASEVAVKYPFTLGSVDITTMGKGEANKAPAQDYHCQFQSTTVAAKPFVKLTYRWTRDKTTHAPAKPTYLNPGQIVTVTEPDGNEKFGLMKEDGSRDTNFDFLKNQGGSKKAKVHVAFWVRVKESGKTVDLVPACFQDDKNLNGASDDVADLFGDRDPYPLLSFPASGTIELTLEKLYDGNLGSYTVTGQTLMTGDPRFNHAPENWKYMGAVSGDISANWYNLEKSYAQQDGKNGDIYMATSDAGYLQSLYELLLLPRIMRNETSTLRQFDGMIRGGDSGLNQMKDHAFMWRSYQPSDFKEIADKQLIVAGDNGPKVNPYSDSSEVLMAAFANTPIDWRAAVTNASSSVNDAVNTKNATATQFNPKYAWNGYNEKERGRICWEHLADFASDFSGRVRSEQNWEKAWREMSWSRSPSELLTGKQLDDTDTRLYSVDKKFLYGFWHDSFAARQQLFLVFVRAEPMMMGGGVAGAAPPQLGARAVALVWRDPSPFAEAQGARAQGGTSTVPDIHRTRILFYHTFD